MITSLRNLWAYPLDFEPYTPADYFEQGKHDPVFRTKLKIGVELVRRAVQVPIPFRAVVADSFYGEDRGFRRGLRELNVGYVLALKPSHVWWHPEAEIGSFQEAAQEAGQEHAERPGCWIKATRTFRDGSSQDWWALELDIRPFGPDKPERVVTTDPATLPDLSTCYLITNLPAPGSPRAQDSAFAAASVEEVVRLYGLRMWVEESYSQVKHALGWSEYQVRSDQAMRRHWQLVCCAFSFCWYHQAHSPCRRATNGFISASSPGSGRAFTLCIDETGDRKKGKTADYVASQYIGNIGKIANGIVSVTAYGVLDHITFPLLFKVYKPHTQLKPRIATTDFLG